MACRGWRARLSETPDRTRIAFVINSIGQGGAERVLSVILSAIGERQTRYEVHLVLLDDLPRARTMPDYVTIHTLDARGGLARSLVQLFLCLRALKPSLIVSLLVRANLTSALVGRLLGAPVIACERMHLSSHLKGRYSPLKLALLTAVLRRAYQFPAVVLGVSSGVTEDLIKNFHVPVTRAATIFNPYPIEAILSAARQAPAFDLPAAYFVAVGRLEPGKNVLQLIDAFAAARISQQLVIIGEGAQRASVAARIAALGLEDRVHLLGYCDNPFPVVARAQAYVSASLNEGFPNAMVEAMVLGVPVVVSDCPSGPAEILGGACHDQDHACDGEFGLLTTMGSTMSLADGLERMAAPDVRGRYAEQAAKRAGDFTADKVTEQYWALFDALSG